MSFRRKWSGKTSLMYAVGVWTAFGALIFPRFVFKKEEELPEGTDETIIKLSSEKEKKITLERSSDNRFSVLTTVTYEPDFVPYTTRLNNYIQSLFADKKEK